MSKHPMVRTTKIVSYNHRYRIIFNAVTVIVNYCTFLALSYEYKVFPNGSVQLCSKEYGEFEDGFQFSGTRKLFSYVTTSNHRSILI